MRHLVCIPPAFWLLSMGARGLYFTLVAMCLDSQPKTTVLQWQDTEQMFARLSFLASGKSDKKEIEQSLRELEAAWLISVDHAAIELRDL